MVTDLDRSQALVRVNTDFKNHVEDEFSSDALGSTYWYTSDHESQVNLIGATIAGMDLNYRCSTTKGGTKTFQAHTAAQIATVFGDGLSYKYAAIVKLAGLENDIANATTQAELDAVQW